MSAACATCKSWNIKTSWLKAANMAPCALEVSYTALRPDHSCERYSALEPAQFAKRKRQMEKLMETYKGMK